MKVIDVQNVYLKYPASKDDTIRGISFDVKQGEIFGFLGPSGAGKSTVQKILTGTLRDYRGSVRVFGDEIRHRTSRLLLKIIGVDFEFPNFYEKFTALENLKYFASIYSGRTTDPLELLEKVGLRPDAGKKVSSYSKGMKMRLGFVRSLLHDPKLLFLDEPTIGLDAVSKIAVRNIIREINRDQGTTIILTTHDTQDIEALTNRILLIGKGRLLLDGDLQMLKKHYSSAKHISIDYTPSPLCGRASDLLDILENGLSVIKDMPGRLEVLADTTSVSVSQVISILNSRLEINDLSITGTTMDEMVVSLYQEYSI